MVWNDMQWYSYSLPFLLMQTFWMDTHWMDPYWWDTCWRYVLVGYVLVRYVCDSCWCTPFEWIRIAWIRTGGIRVWTDTYWWDTYCKPADANVLNAYALHGYVLVGYVLNGYVWDMCGVMDMCGICVVWDMCGICVVWDTPTIFWRTLRRNVFREKKCWFENSFLAVMTLNTFQVFRSAILDGMRAVRTHAQETWQPKPKQRLHHLLGRWPPMATDGQELLGLVQLSMLGFSGYEKSWNSCIFWFRTTSL